MLEILTKLRISQKHRFDYAFRQRSQNIFKQDAIHLGRTTIFFKISVTPPETTYLIAQKTQKFAFLQVILIIKLDDSSVHSDRRVVNVSLITNLAPTNLQVHIISFQCTLFEWTPLKMKRKLSTSGGKFLRFEEANFWDIKMVKRPSGKTWRHYLGSLQRHIPQKYWRKVSNHRRNTTHVFIRLTLNAQSSRSANYCSSYEANIYLFTETVV